MTSYARLRQDEWEATQDRAFNKFKDELGDRPTKSSVARKLHNPHSISLLEWLGFVLLIAIGIHTAYKMTAVALPFAHSFFPNSDPSGILVGSFAVFTSIAFILFSTSGLIYSKLMDEYDEEIEKQKRKHNKLIFYGGWQGSIGAGILTSLISHYVLNLTPEYTMIIFVATFIICVWFGGIPTNLLQFASPRLYGWITYIIALWLFQISSEGQGSVFAQYTIVIAEIALAYLVAQIIEKRAKWSEIVHSAWMEMVEPYDLRIKKHRTDSLYLEVLFRELREALMLLQRKQGKQRVKPNYRIFTEADPETIQRLVLKEYERHTGGLQFAATVLNSKAGEVRPIDPTAQPEVKGKRIPPHGDKDWSVTSLRNDFIARGLAPDEDYNEVNLAEDYKAGYSARKAFRDGARTYFHAYSK